jgi:hypothetical protein
VVPASLIQPALSVARSVRMINCGRFISVVGVRSSFAGSDSVWGDAILKRGGQGFDFFG